ncbi:hypothetical protein MPER_10896 [Moniliophthora perniciosa FA553]|nr:hypothetical protein MPER_10896 [Moniliophthora perniciosa FA553]
MASRLARRVKNHNSSSRAAKKDTAQDVYETEDVAPSSQAHGDSSDDEGIAPTRSALRSKNGEASKEELDSSHLINAEEASKKFRRAEKRRGVLSVT